MVAKGGSSLLDGDAVTVLKKKLLPMAALVTPNLPEAEALTGILPVSEHRLRNAAMVFKLLGCNAVLFKGGHGEGAESVDFLVMNDSVVRLAASRVATKNTHGTGCTLSSAVAAGLAKGESLEAAVRAAKSYVSAAIAAADRLGVGHGHGPVHHFHKFD